MTTPASQASSDQQFNSRRTTNYACVAHNQCRTTLTNRKVGNREIRESKTGHSVPPLPAANADFRRSERRGRAARIRRADRRRAFAAGGRRYAERVEGAGIGSIL